MHRIRILTLAALVVPMASAAQQAAPANPITASYIASGARYAGWLTATFDSIPASRYGYKPTPVQQTIGYVAPHLEEGN